MRYANLSNTDINTQVPQLRPVLLAYTKEEMATLDADGILAGHETSATLVTTATVFLNQPPCPRQITAIVASADAAEVTADSTITIYGTNIDNKAISEVLTFTANLATAKTTAKAFKTITSIVFSAQADGTPAFDVGWNDTFGLPFMLSEAAFVFEMFNNAIQTTYGTLTTDADEIEKNTYNPNGTLDTLKALSLLIFL